MTNNFAIYRLWYIYVFTFLSQNLTYMQNVCLLPHKVYHIQAGRLLIKLREKFIPEHTVCANWITAYRKNVEMLSHSLISICSTCNQTHREYTTLSLLFIAGQLNVSLPGRCDTVALSLNAYRTFPVGIPCGVGGDKLLILQQWLHC